MLNDLTGIVGITAGVCTSTSLLPQLIKLFRTKKAEDLSLFYLILLLVGLALWVFYGILRKDAPIIATNAFAFLLNIIIIIAGLKFRSASEK